MMSVCRAILLISVLACAGCASEEPGKLVSQTSKPVPVDAVADNEKVLGGLMPGLVITLEIDGNEPTLRDARVAMVPRLPALRQEGELIHVVGLRSGDEVSSVAFPDERINVQEHRGIVTMDKRTLTTTLPLPEKIDTLEVRLPRDAGRSRFSVREQIEKFCEKYPQSELCR